MSKKLLIILICIVLAVGGGATAVTAIVFNPANKAERSLKSGYSAAKVRMVLSQTHYGDEVNRVITDYEKSDGEYVKSEKTFKLSQDPLSQTLYDIEEKNGKTSSVDFFAFKVKPSYFTDSKQTDVDGGATTLFSADVKEKRISDFFKDKDVSGFSQVSLTVEYRKNTIIRYTLRYVVEGDVFTISANFDYTSD